MVSANLLELARTTCHEVFMAEENESRELLKEELEQALHSDVHEPRNLDILMERYPFLRRVERAALVQLCNWQADAGTRRLHPEFAAFSRQRLSGILSALN